MEKIKYKNILVLDLESSCWKKDQDRYSQQNICPKGQQSEIIEIGVTVIDVVSLTPTVKEGILVKPTVSTISEFCTELTTLTQELLDKEGITFVEACKILVEKYDSKNALFVSYGRYDQRMFESQCKSFNVEYPFGPEHWNVKAMFAAAYNLKKEVGMAKALNIAKIPLEGTHHRGVFDSWNIAKIVVDLLSKQRLQNA